MQAPFETSEFTRMYKGKIIILYFAESYSFTVLTSVIESTMTYPWPRDLRGHLTVLGLSLGSQVLALDTCVFDFITASDDDDVSELWQPLYQSISYILILRLFLYCSFILRFSQTWLRYVWLYAMANPSVCLSVCRLWRACTLLRGFNFSGIFLHHVMCVRHILSTTIRQLTHQKSRRSSKGITPNRGVKCKGVGKVVISDQYLAIARKRLKVDGYMLRCVWPALNLLSIHVTFSAVVSGAYPGEAKMC